MKRIYFFITASMIWGASVSQTLKLSVDTVKVTGYSDVTEFIAHATIHNTSSDSVEVKWIRFINNLPENWLSAVCDGDRCYLAHVSSAVFRMKSDSVDNFDVHFYPNDVSGDAIVQLRAWVVGDSANTVVVGTFKGTAVERPVSIASRQEREKIMLYPNPARDYILIKNLPQREISTIEVYNIFGRRMLSFSQAPDNNDAVQRFDINTLSKGIYMIRIFDSAMNVIHTESLSKE